MKKENAALTVIERAALALGTSERESSLRALVEQSLFITEIKNGAARDQCHGALMKLRTTRTEITKAGKEARDDANAFSKAVIAEEKRLVALLEPEEERLQALRDAWDAAREAERREKAEAEAKRIAAIREHIDDIRAIVSRVAGRSSAQIQIDIDDLVALQIDIERFAELTGEAEVARSETLDKLRDMHAAALAQEAEAKRLAEEAERLARERAAFEEEQRRAAAERAEQERKEAAARAEREAQERAEREARERAEAEQRAREEAARREQQAREDAERRAAIEAEEARLAADRAEMARRQAELDRAEREQQEREAAAAREMAEAAEKAERDLRERQRAEQVAARNAPEVTGGLWFVRGTEVLTTVKLAGAAGTGHNSSDYYGDGALIAESVWRPADAQLIAAAPELLAACIALTEGLDASGISGTYLDTARAAIARATYVAEIEEATA